MELTKLQTEEVLKQFLFSSLLFILLHLPFAEKL